MLEYFPPVQCTVLFGLNAVDHSALLASNLARQCYDNPRYQLPTPTVSIPLLDYLSTPEGTILLTSTHTLFLINEKVVCYCPTSGAYQIVGWDGETILIRGPKHELRELPVSF